MLHQKHDVAHERFGRDIGDLVAAITMLRKGSAPPMRWGRITAGVAALVLIAGGMAVAAKNFLAPNAPDAPKVTVAPRAPQPSRLPAQVEAQEPLPSVLEMPTARESPRPHEAKAAPRDGSPSAAPADVELPATGEPQRVKTLPVNRDGTIATSPPTSPAAEQQVASLATDPAELTRAIQEKLRTAGCLEVAANGTWGPRTKAAAAAFNQHTKSQIDTSGPTPAALVALEKATGGCPIKCEEWQNAENRRCVDKPCPAGLRLHRDSQCWPPGTTYKPDHAGRSGPVKGVLAPVVATRLPQLNPPAQFTIGHTLIPKGFVIWGIDIFDSFPRGHADAFGRELAARLAREPALVVAGVKFIGSQQTRHDAFMRAWFHCMNDGQLSALFEIRTVGGVQLGGTVDIKIDAWGLGVKDCYSDPHNIMKDQIARILAKAIADGVF